jgi:hypothetical protein
MQDNNEPKKLACYRLLIDENDDTEVNYISMVEDPAIKIDWFAFSNGDVKPKEQEFKFKTLNKEHAEKRMISGVFMVPDKPIYRVDKESGEEYFVMFTADDIERARNKFMKSRYNNQIDTEHNEIANGCYLVDTWILRDEDSNPVKKYGFENIPVGAWVGTIKVDDDAIWNDFIKTGKIKGFSVSGMFKFGKKSLINTFKDEKTPHTFTAEELKFISDIADFLLDDENI